MSEERKEIWELLSEEEMAELLEPIKEKAPEKAFSGRVAEKAAALLETWTAKEPAEVRKPARGKGSRFLRWAIPAACLLLALGGLVLGPQTFPSRKETAQTTEAQTKTPETALSYYTTVLTAAEAKMTDEPTLQAPPTQLADEQNPLEVLEESGQTSASPGVPPISVSFESRDDIRLLLSFGRELSEEDAQQYNASPGRGVDRDSYEKVYAWLKEMPLPESEEWLTWNMYIYPDRGREYAFFGFDAGRGSVFWVGIDLSGSDPQEKLKEAADRNGYQLEAVENPNVEALYYCRPAQQYSIEMYYGIVDGYFFSLSCARAEEAYRNQVASTLHFIKAGEIGSD